MNFLDDLYYNATSRGITVPELVGNKIHSTFTTTKAVAEFTAKKINSSFQSIASSTPVTATTDTIAATGKAAINLANSAATKTIDAVKEVAKWAFTCFVIGPALIVVFNKP